MKLLQKATNGYIKNARIIGFFYCFVPVIIWFSYILLTTEFREVYILRFFLSIFVGGFIASYLNEYGLKLWLIKYYSQDRAGILDGFIIGSCLGIGIAIFPSLTSLIYSNHIEQAKWFIIFSWLASWLIGGVIGSMLAKTAKNILPKTILKLKK